MARPPADGGGKKAGKSAGGVRALQVEVTELPAQNMLMHPIFQALLQKAGVSLPLKITEADVEEIVQELTEAALKGAGD